MKTSLLLFRSQFRQWYHQISIRDLAFNRPLTDEIRELEKRLGELINESR